MTLNLSGGREGLPWGLGLSNADPGQFLGDLASDPAIANLLKNSFTSSVSPVDSETFNVKRRGADSLRESREEEDRPTSRYGDIERDSVAADSVTDVTVEMTHCARTSIDHERARRTSNGWSNTRPQTLMQNGLTRRPIPPNSCSPTSPRITSPLAPPHMHQTPSPHSTASTPPSRPPSHSPHCHGASAVSSPATPTDGFPSTSSTTSSRTPQPVAASPFTASKLPSSLHVNMLNQISTFDLVDTVVTLKSSSRDVILQGQVGVVKYVMTGETATVHILSTDSDIRVPCSSLEAVRPRPKDAVKVIGGAHCLGRIGTLVSITGEYGIVKFMRGDNIAQIPIRNLGKYAPTKASGAKTIDYLNKSTTSPSSPPPTSSSKELPDSTTINPVNGTTANFPFVYYPPFSVLIPGATPQPGGFVSLPGPTSVQVTTNDDATRNGNPYTTARIFPGMMSPFMVGSSLTNSGNGIGTSREFSSSSPSSHRHNAASMYCQTSRFSLMYPPMLSGGHLLKSDDTSPTRTFKDGGPSSSFSFTRQDSTEKDSVLASTPSASSKDLLNICPTQFHPFQSPVLSSLDRPSVIQSSSTNSTGAIHRKGLLHPSNAIEKAKAFMVTAMGVCPQRIGPVARGGGGGGDMVGYRGVGRGGDVHGHSLSNSHAPLPYSTDRLGPHSASAQHQQKVNPEDRIKSFLERLVGNRRSYTYRRNSGEGNHDVKTSCIRISLICPLSQKRMSYPCRGQSCRHHQCFDADAYIRYNMALRIKKKVMKQPSGKGCVQSVMNKKWQCPICHATVTANQLYIDKDIYTAVKESSAQEVELSDDGSWRPVQKEEKKIEVIDLTDLDD